MMPDTQSKVDKLMKRASEGETFEERSASQDEVLAMVKESPDLIWYIKDRYIAKHRDQFELHHGLAILMMTDSLDPGLESFILDFIHDPSIHLSYKRDGVFILTRMVESVSTQTFESEMRKLDAELKITLANDLIGHLFRCSDGAKRLRLLQLCLTSSSSDSDDSKSCLLSAVVVGGGDSEREQYIALYRDALGVVQAPQDKMVLLLGLVEMSPTNCTISDPAISELAAASPLARWYLESHRKTNEFYEDFMRKHGR